MISSIDHKLTLAQWFAVVTIGFTTTAASPHLINSDMVQSQALRPLQSANERGAACLTWFEKHNFRGESLWCGMLPLRSYHNQWGDAATLEVFFVTSDHLALTITTWCLIGK